MIEIRVDGQRYPVWLCALAIAPLMLLLHYRLLGLEFEWAMGLFLAMQFAVGWLVMRWEDKEVDRRIARREKGLPDE